MAKKNFDGIIEAVRYARNGQIDFVRAYERRGDTFSDRVLIDRKTLLARLRSRKRFVIGRRLQFLASTFENAREVHLVQQNGNEFVSTRAEGTRDELEGAPLI